VDVAADVPVSPERNDRMIDKVLGGMRNDGGAQRSFREEYAAVDEQGPRSWSSGRARTGCR
jgi:hypothetical protein